MSKLFSLSNDDRKALIIILLLSALFVGYTAYHQYSYTPPLSVGNNTPPNSYPFVTDSLRRDSLSEKSLKKDSIKKQLPPITTSRYPGPPKRQAYIPKLKRGATIELNTADTTLLKRVPGIGSSFAKRIVKYRRLLGGYYCVEQLQEVFGMDRERYDKIAPFFTIRTTVQPIYISRDSISRHPYLSYRHRAIILQILREHPPLTWEKLMATPDFRRDDSLRLAPYMRLPLSTNRATPPTP